MFIYLTFLVPSHACIYVPVVACPVAIAGTINLNSKKKKKKERQNSFQYDSAMSFRPNAVAVSVTF
jgi:hypothetical protein